MSAVAARATRSGAGPAVKPVGRGASRPVSYLRLVANRRSHAAKAPFIAVVVGVLALGLLTLLLLNTVLAQDAFRLHSLQVQSRLLADQEQGLQREVEQVQSPQSLAARAIALGMVPGGPPAFLRLSDGKVLGAAVPGAAAPPGAAAVPGAGAVPAAAPVAPTAGVRPAAASKPKPLTPTAGTWVLVPPPAHKKSGGHR
ncbi:MAG: hypothetical protein NVSMB55_04980 [Mycobacteriales bacterium]